MDQKMKKWMKIFMNREVVMYLIFGVLTTLVDFLVYLALTATGHVTAAAATAAAWLAAVMFAYVTNRRYVFGCEGNIIRFAATRLCSGLVQVLLMAALVDGLHLQKLVTKLAVGVLVTVMNYVGSKLLVFRKTDKEALRLGVSRERAGSTADRSRVAL